MKSLFGKVVLSLVAAGVLSSLGFSQRYGWHHHRWSHSYWTSHRYWHHYHTYWRNNGAGYWGYHGGVRVWIPL